MSAGVAVRGDPRYRRWVVATTLGELGGFAIPAGGLGMGLTVALVTGRFLIRLLEEEGMGMQATDDQDVLEIEAEDVGSRSLVSSLGGHAGLPARQRLLPVRRAGAQQRPALAQLLGDRGDVPGDAAVP